MVARRYLPIWRLFGALAAALVLACAEAVLPGFAQAPYPERPITVLVPFAAGGTTDIIARLMAEPMSRALGQQVIVDNAPGGGGTVGVTRVARATPDGYTLLMGNLGTQVASVGLYARLAYDPQADFEPIMNTGGTPMVVAAKRDLPVKDFREFIEYVKSNAKQVNYGTGGVGATSHLTCLFLDSLLGVQPQHIPFRGSGPALNALLGGQVDYVCDQTVAIVPAIQSGQVKGLAVATPTRLSALPDMPTSAEQGLPEFQAVGWNALFAPKGTPAPVLEKLNAAARAAMADATVRNRLAELSVELPDAQGQSRGALGELLRKELDKWVPIIKKAGVVVQ